TIRLPSSPACLCPYTTLFRSRLLWTWRVTGYCTSGHLLCYRFLHAARLNRACTTSRNRGPAAPYWKPHGRPRMSVSKSKSRRVRSEDHTSELQSRENLVCRLL